MAKNKYIFPSTSRKMETRYFESRFTRRTMLVGGVSTLAMVSMVGQLYYLQNEQGKYYKTLSENNRISVIPTIPERGIIFDRENRIIADNIKSHLLLYDRQRQHHENDLINTLDFLYDNDIINHDAYDAVLTDARQDNKARMILISNQLAWEHLSYVMIHQINYPYLHVKEIIYRHYPYSHSLVHILGYTGLASPSDKERLKGKILPKQIVGKNAIEQNADKILLGNAGRNIVETNAYGHHVRIIEKQKPIKGNKVHLTIDSKLQYLIYQHIENTPGAAVVIDIHDGSILAMVSTPAYDPNVFARGITQKEYNNLLQNPYNPFYNKAMVGLFAPGSAIKPVIALAAMEKNIPTNHAVDCQKIYELGDYKYHCWHKHHVVDMHDAIMRSCDIWFYNIAEKMGIDHMYRYLHMMGLGQQYDLFGMNNKSGILPNVAWKKKHFQEAWYTGESLIASIGQGYMLTTPLQLAVMTARLASGKNIIPTIHHHQKPIFDPLHINKNFLKVVHHAMFNVVNHVEGTAFKQRLDINNIKMSGKTGTAQVRRISQQERDDIIINNEELPWHLRDHAIFVGFAPHDTPRYAVSFIAEHGGSGSRNAAPVVKYIYETMHQLGYFNA